MLRVAANPRCIKKVNSLFYESYSLLSGWQKFYSSQLGGLSCFPLGLDVSSIGLTQSHLVLSLPSTQLMTELFLVPWFFSVPLRLKDTHSTPQLQVPVLWVQLLRHLHSHTHPGTLGCLWGLPEDWGTRVLFSQLSQIRLWFLLSFPTATLQATLEEAGRSQPASSGSYLLMILIAVSQPCLDCPPPSKAEHLHSDSRVWQRSLMHA